MVVHSRIRRVLNFILLHIPVSSAKHYCLTHLIGSSNLSHWPLYSILIYYSILATCTDWHCWLTECTVLLVNIMTITVPVCCTLSVGFSFFSLCLLHIYGISTNSATCYRKSFFFFFQLRPVAGAIQSQGLHGIAPLTSAVVSIDALCLWKVPTLVKFYWGFNNVPEVRYGITVVEVKKHRL